MEIIMKIQYLTLKNTLNILWAGSAFSKIAFRIIFICNVYRTNIFSLVGKYINFRLFVFFFTFITDSEFYATSNVNGKLLSQRPIMQ